MAGTVAVREFTSVSEMQAHYAAIRRKTFSAQPVRQPEPAPQVQPEPPAEETEIELDAEQLEQFRSVRVLSMEERTGSACMNGAEAIALTSAVTGITRTNLTSGVRQKHIVKARHIAYWLLVNYAGKSYPRAGAMLGGRDHSTILTGCRRVAVTLSRIEGELPDTPEGIAQLLWVIDWPKTPTRNGRPFAIKRPRCTCCGTEFEAP